MKHSLSAAVALACSLGLVAAAQAHGVTRQSMAPSSNHQTAGQITTGQMQPAATDARLSRQEIKQAQQQLKSDGLYKGRVDGIMGRGTRVAVARFQQRNGLQRTARLDRNTLDRLTSAQGVGVGSSMPANSNASTSNMNPNLTQPPAARPAEQAPSAAGGTGTPTPPANQNTNNK